MTREGDDQAEAGFAAGRGLRVVDLGAGMAAAMVSALLADSGALVQRVAPTGDGVFDEIYPAHRAWRAAAVPATADGLDELLSRADVCLVGGEDHPAVATRHDAAALAARFPRLVVLDLTGYVDGHAPGAPAVDLLAQARTGLVAEHYSDRPLFFAVPFPTYGQALLGTLGVWAALVDLAGGGRGQVVTASLQQGTALFMMPLWMSAERADAEFHKVTPKDVEHLIFRCADGTYVQFAMGVESAVAKLYRILDIDVPVDPADRGIPRLGATAQTYFGDRPLIARHVARKRRAGILAAARSVGLPAAPVLEPGQFWADEQTAANGLLVERAGATVVGGPIRLTGARERPGGRAAPAAPAARGGGPLAGVRVLDFGSYVAGPFASRLLGDLGASVTKVEALSRDPNRGLQRHFIACQSGKRAIAVDLKSPAGREVVRRLLRDADVVTHNLRPAAAARLGLSPEMVRAVNPDAVMLRTFAFGPTGPRVDDPGFDMIIQALVGLERRAGGAQGPPLWYRTPYLDYAVGAMGAIGVLMAWHERLVAGRVGNAWVSLLNAGMFLLSDLCRTSGGELRGAPGPDPTLRGAHPAEHLYGTADGWVAVAARDEAQARALWGVLLPGEQPPPRAAWDAAVTARFDAAAARWETGELLAALAAAGVWVERCRCDGLAALTASPAAAAAHLVVDRVDDRLGRVTGSLGPLVTFSRTALDTRDRPAAPGFGAHTRPVLAELGYPEPAIDVLLAAGVVRAEP
ncbi:CoA transferase [Pseudofrankia sp. DC12]|uniref:CoA transferase n=1 Tax=Pseudofrankia sp. DC12 TaxID=683315 RepID=UPI0005F88CC6|nr:CoA transferase [Pseudofrankia sp. DC12]